MLPNAIDLHAAFSELTEYWSPHVVGRLNGDYVKVAKVLGEFVWHDHRDQDELFLVMRGRLTIALEGDRSVAIGPGELYVVPRGVRHCPSAAEETWIVLIEPIETQHTGDLVTERTRSIGDQLA